MAKYLLTANYTKKGAKGLMKEGGYRQEGRRARNWPNRWAVRWRRCTSLSATPMST